MDDIAAPRWYELDARRWSRPRLALYLGLLHLGLVYVTFLPAPHTGGDNGVYVSLGRALLRGAYVDLFDPAAPPHTQYPPVYPLIVAAGQALGLEPWVGLKMLTALASVLAVLATALWLDHRAGRAAALAMGVLVATSPGVLFQSHWVLSDVPFWAFTMLAIGAWEGLDGAGARRFGIATTATLLAFFTRSAGLPLVLAAFAWLAYRRRYRDLAIFAALSLPLILLWVGRSLAVGDGGYLDQMLLVQPYRPDLGIIGIADLLERIGQNAERYAWSYGPLVLLGSDAVAARVAGVGVALLALIGWVRQLRRPRVAEWFAPLYTGLLLLWPAVWAGQRFLLPLLPLVLFYAGTALLALVARIRARWVPVAATGLVIGLGLATGPSLYRGTRAGVACTKAYLDGVRYPCLEAGTLSFLDMAEFAGRRVPGGESVISRKPALFYVTSGRTSRMFPLSRDPVALISAAREAGVRYVVLDRVDSVSRLYLVPAVMRRPDAFCAMRTFPDGTTLLGIREDAERVADARGDPGAVALSIGFRRCPVDYWSSSSGSSSGSRSGSPPPR